MVTPEDQRPEVSKSQLKREAQELFDLGRQLVDLPPARLESVARAAALDPDLLEAIEFARSIRARVARKRQIGYVARLLRRIDASPIAEALEAVRTNARRATVSHHRAEAWRDHLLAGGDAALGSFIGLRDDADPQALRQLIRNACREAERSKPPASARKLFKMLRGMDEEEPLPTIPDRE